MLLPLISFMAKLVYTSNLVDSMKSTGQAHTAKFESNGAKILKLLFHGASLQQGTPYGAAQVGFPQSVRQLGGNNGASIQAGAQPVSDFLSFFGDQFEITDSGKTFRKNGMFSWEFTHNKLTNANIRNYFSNKILNYLEIIESEHLDPARTKFSSLDSIRAAAPFDIELKNGGPLTDVVYNERTIPQSFSQPNQQDELEWNLMFVIGSPMNNSTKGQMTNFVNHLMQNQPQNCTVQPITQIIPGQGQPANYPGAVEIEFNNANLPKLRVGFIPSNSFIDLAAEIEEICQSTNGIEDGAKKRQFLSRCIGMMTGDAFSPQNARFLHGIHENIPQLSQALQSFSSVKNQGQMTFTNGAVANKYSITGLLQKQLAQLSIVPRTLRNPEALQRPPNWKHLSGMAESIVMGKSFALPVIAITDGSTTVNDQPQVQQINPHGVQFMTPNNWEIVDGQHRVYSYFALPAGQGNVSLDLQLLVFSPQVTIQQQREAAAELFFDINHRSLEPDKVHAIAHYSKFDDFDTGWRFRNSQGQGNNRINGDKATWSSRLIAGKFILELNSRHNSPFVSLFDVHGIDSSKIPLASVTQYLSGFFEFGRKWWVNQGAWQDKLLGNHSIYAKFQVQHNGNQIFPTDNTWKGMTQGGHEYRGPSPKSSDLQHFWPYLIDEFQSFLDKTGLNHNQITGLFSENSAKSARLPAIFSLFAWYYCQAPGAGGLQNPAQYSGRSLDPAVNPQVNALTQLGLAMQDPVTWQDLPTGRSAVAAIAGKLYNGYVNRCNGANPPIAHHTFGPEPNGITAANGGPPSIDDLKRVKWIPNPK